MQIGDDSMLIHFRPQACEPPSPILLGPSFSIPGKYSRIFCTATAKEVTKSEFQAAPQAKMDSIMIEIRGHGEVKILGIPPLGALEEGPMSTLGCNPYPSSRCASWVPCERLRGATCQNLTGLTVHPCDYEQ